MRIFFSFTFSLKAVIIKASYSESIEGEMMTRDMAVGHIVVIPF